VTFRPGASGNPNGRPKGPSPLTTRIRGLVERTIEIVKTIIEAAKLGDIEARRQFLKYLLPRSRTISTPVDLPVVQSAGEVQEQIAMLTAMAARGDLDLDALHILSRTLMMAIDARLSEIEEIVSEREHDAV
jgi:hypothetical protein